MRAVALRQRQARQSARRRAHARCTQHLSEGHSQDLRLCTGTVAKPDRHRLALPGTERPVPASRTRLPHACLREANRIPAALDTFDATLKAAREPLDALQAAAGKLKDVPVDKKQPLADALAEWAESAKPYESDRAALLKKLAAFRKQHETA